MANKDSYAEFGGHGGKPDSIFYHDLDDGGCSARPSGSKIGFNSMEYFDKYGVEYCDGEYYDVD